MGRLTIESDSLVNEKEDDKAESRVGADTRNPL